MALTKIKTGGIADNAITNAKMADDAIDSADFADGSIDNVHVATGLDAVKLADGTVTNTEFQYINTLSSNAQTQISAKAPIASPTFTGNFTSVGIDDNADATAITIDSSENVGIGCTPAFSLDVQSAGDAIAWRTSAGLLGKLGYPGSDTDNGMILLNNAGSDTVKILGSGASYFNGGNVGIGESTPLATLHIKEGDSGLSSLNGSGTNLFLEANGANAAGMTIASGNTANGYIIFGDSDSNFRGAIQYDHSTPDKMHFVTAGSQRLSIDQNGNVGIGVTTPTAGGASGTPKLHVNGAARIDGNVAIAPDSGTPYISGGSTGTQWRNNANGATLLTILDGGKVGIGTTSPSAKLDVSGDTSHIPYIYAHGETNDFNVEAVKGLVTGTDGDNTGGWFEATGSSDLNIGVFAKASGATNNFAISAEASAGHGYTAELLKLRNSSSGNVAIGFWNYQGEIATITGETNDVGTGSYNDGTIQFHTAYDGTLTNRLQIENNGTLVGSATNDISDGELKKNIKNITNGIDTIKQLQGRTFEWKVSASMPDGVKYGLIAQELEEVLPDLVYDKTGIRQKADGSWYKSIAMSGVIPVLIEAVKELSAKVEALENA